MTTLDITNFKQKGQELYDEIVKTIKPYATTKLYVTMPDLLFMTQSQYDDLMEINKLPNMYHQEDRMFTTPYNVMEVRVTDRKKLTFKEAHSLSGKQFDRWEKSVKGEHDG